MNKGLQLNSHSRNDFVSLIKSLIEDREVSTVLEIGSGPNPILNSDYVQAKKLTYHLNDASKSELTKGNHPFETVVGTIGSGEIEFPVKYDLIFSKMVMEHVHSPKNFHSEVLNLLSDSGIVVHYFATLYSPASVLNLMIPEWFSAFLVKKSQARNAEKEAKFPAKYKWCRGPSKSNAKKFEKLGYRIQSYNGYIGHGYLSAKKAWPLEKALNKFFLHLGSPLFCSTAILVMNKNPTSNQ